VDRSARLPPQSFFLVSAVFHYLGPSLAVLLFARLDVLGVAWLRIASAAVVFAIWRRPWQHLHIRDTTLIALGVVLAAMNSLFYLAVDRLPLSTVGAIEFLGTVILAAAGARTRRNALALALTTTGVATITAIRLAGHPLGFVFAFGNCVLFMVYVLLGHRIATKGRGIDQLGASMLIAAIVATPIGLAQALPAFTHPILLAAGATPPRHFRADARAAAGVRDADRRGRAPPAPHRPGHRRHRPGHRWRRHSQGHSQGREATS
jgi:inner membrane transporter RhtA